MHPLDAQKRRWQAQSPWRITYAFAVLIYLPTHHSFFSSLVPMHILFHPTPGYNCFIFSLTRIDGLCVTSGLTTRMRVASAKKKTTHRHLLQHKKRGSTLVRVDKVFISWDLRALWRHSNDLPIRLYWNSSTFQRPPRFTRVTRDLT